MKNGVCPKCNSRDILVFEQDAKDDDKKGGDFEKLKLLGGKIYTVRYVCCNCGFTERYFEGKDLEKLKKKFGKVRG